MASRSAGSAADLWQRRATPGLQGRCVLPFGRYSRRDAAACGGPFRAPGAPALAPGDRQANPGLARAEEVQAARIATQQAIAITHQLAVRVLTAAWEIRPEGVDVDDITDLLGCHLERAAYEEIARGLTEVAAVPHDQMRDQLRAATQRDLARRAHPSHRWVTTTETYPARYPSGRHLEAHLLDAHLEQAPGGLGLHHLEGFHAQAHRWRQGRPHRHGHTPTRDGKPGTEPTRSPDADRASDMSPPETIPVAQPPATVAVALRVWGGWDDYPSVGVVWLRRGDLEALLAELELVAGLRYLRSDVVSLRTWDRRVHYRDDGAVPGASDGYQNHWYVYDRGFSR